MFRQITNEKFKLLLAITLLCVSVLAQACQRAGEPSSNSSPSKPTAASSSGGGDFEGTIAMRMDGEDRKGMEMTYFLKGRHTRIEANMGDAPEQQAVVLWDLDEAKMTTLMPSRKMYMTMDLKAMAESMKGVTKEMKKSQGEGEEKFPKLTPTGKQETIAGYTCEHWLMGDNQELDMCVAKGLGYFGMGGQGGQGSFGALKNFAFSEKLLAEAQAHPEWVKLLEGGAFPLKITATEQGKIKMNMEATKIEKKSLEDSLFVIPPDYKELNMGNFRGGKQ